MRVKFFAYEDTKELQQDINHWLSTDGKMVRIKHIKQNKSYNLTTISIWYV